MKGTTLEEKLEFQLLGHLEQKETQFEYYQQTTDSHIIDNRTY